MKSTSNHTWRGILWRVRLLGIGVVRPAVMVLAGWVGDLAALKRGRPGRVSRKPNTALAFRRAGTTVAGRKFILANSLASYERRTEPL